MKSAIYEISLFKRVCMAATTLSVVMAPTIAAAQTAAATEAEESGDVVIVTGIRGSLKAAQDLKREATTVVDAVTSEDLADFADTNVADALQRIPGVQIQRNQDGRTGDLVSIRGLGPQFVQYTINGRTPLSSGERAFRLEILPTEILQTLSVHKTPTADMVESGLAGTVDLTTLHPLDYNADGTFFGTVIARSDYNEFNEETSPRYSGLLGFQNADKTFGAYVAATYADTKNRRDIVENYFVELEPVNIDLDEDGVLDPGETYSDAVTSDPERGGLVAVPRRLGQSIIREDDKRTAFAGGVDWRPTSSLEISADALYSKLERFTERDGMDVIYGEFRLFSPGGSDPVLWDPDSIEIANGQVQYLDAGGVTGNFGGAATEFLQLGGPREEETKLLGLNGTYDDDTWIASFDVSYSENETIETNYTGGIHVSAPRTVDLDNNGTITDDERFSGASFNFYNISTLPQNGLLYDERGGRQARPVLPSEYLDLDEYATYGPANIGFNRSAQEQDAYRVDFGRRFRDFGLFDEVTLKVGARWQNTEFEFRSAANFSFALTQAQEAAIRAAELTGETLQFGNGEAGIPVIPAANSFGGSLGSVAFFQEIALFAAPGFFAHPFTDLSNYSNGAWFTQARNKLTEETFAAYVQSDFRTNGEIPLSGSVGLRAVQDKREIFGNVQVGVELTPSGFGATPIASQVVTANYEDWYYLPNFNLKIEARDDLAVRVSAAKTLSRPAFGSLSANSDLNFNPFTSFFSTYGGGNPALAPYSAVQIDVGVEYYTANDGALYASWFHKDVEDFISSTTQRNVAVPGFDQAFFQSLAPEIQQLYTDEGLTDLVTNDPRFLSGLIGTVNLPGNISSGWVDGFEFGLNQPFTFLPSPFDGFGVQANYTFVKSELEGGDSFPGAAENNANAIIYYEKGRFGARVALAYRGEYDTGQNDTAGRSQIAEATTYVNASANVDLTENIELSLEVVNLTEQNYQEYADRPGNFSEFVVNPRIVTVGAKYSF